ncbi:MAG: hypothetical protein ACNA8R_00960 [Nitriliruptoraceae bacterium]
MRIHRIALEDVRGLRRAEVALATDRVTVVEAPNETGKTTLFDALDVLLHERDRAGKKHVRALKPVDRDVPSTIEADITLGPHRLTVRKRFNKQPATELTITTPTRRQLTGDAAHDELQRLLEEHTDLALLEALRFRQGRSLDPVTLDTSRTLAGLLDAGAGGAGVGDEDALFDRVVAEAVRYHTDKARTPTRLLADAADAVAAAEAEVARLEQLEAELAAAAQRAAEVAAEQRALQHHREALVPVLAERREAARLVGELRSQRRTAAAAVEVAAATQARAAAAATARRELVEERGRTEAAVADAEQRRDVAVAQLAPAQAALADQDAAVTRLEAEVEERRASLTTLRLRADLAHTVRELERTRARRRRIGAAHEAARDAAAALAGTRSTPTRHARVRAAVDALRLAEARLGAEAPTVRITAHRDLTVATVDQARAADPAQLAAGERLEHAVPDRIRLRLADLADVEVTAGRSLAERQDAARAAAAEVHEACDDLGVSDPAEAETLAEVVAAHRATLAERDAIVARELDGEDLDALEDALRDHEAAAVSLRERLGDQAGIGEPDRGGRGPGLADLAAPVPEPAELEQREAALAELQTAMVAARAERSTRAAVVTAHRDAVVTAEASVAAVAAERDRVATALERARTIGGDAALATDVRMADEALAQARAALGRVEEQLAARDADAVELAVETAAAELQAVEQRQARLREEAAGLAGRIEVRGGDGVGEALQAATAELHRRRRDRDALQRRAAAARALREVFEGAREEAYAAYRAPLRERIVAAGRLVLGADLDVELDEALSITSRTLAGTSLAFEQLSAGAREQLAILTALAAADLAGDGGVPVVLDDTLGYTDPARLERLAALLGRVRGPQVIVLTCVGSRFAAIPNAVVVHLRDGSPPAGAAG